MPVAYEVPKIHVLSIPAPSVDADLVVVPVAEDHTAAVAAEFDTAVGGSLGVALARGEFTPRPLESARRHVSQADEAVSRLAGEVAALREWSDATARLSVARRLSDGADGGVLATLVAALSDDGSPGEAREEAAALLSRLTEALGLAPIARRGEWLALSAEELGEFDVRGLTGSLPPSRRRYCVVRSGWWLDSFVVERPLLEPVGREEP